ncbi:hypothetical protein ACVWZV_006216 [Bradyrhizobium sp. GM5.1]
MNRRASSRSGTSGLYLLLAFHSSLDALLCLSGVVGEADKFENLPKHFEVIAKAVGD